MRGVGNLTRAAYAKSAYDALLGNWGAIFSGDIPLTDH